MSTIPVTQWRHFPLWIAPVFLFLVGAFIFLDAAIAKLLLLITLTLGPVVYFLSKRIVSSLVIVLLAQFLGFCFYRLLLWVVWAETPSRSSLYEIDALLVANLLMLFAYGLGQFVFKTKEVSLSDGFLSVEKKAPILLVGLVALAALLSDWHPSALNQFLLTMEGICLVALFCTRSESEKKLLIGVQAAVVVGVFVYYVKFKSLAVGVNLAAVFAILFLISHQKRFLIGFVGLVGLLAVFQSVKGEFRRPIERPVAGSLVENSNHLTEILSKRLRETPHQSFQGIHAINRLNSLRGSFLRLGDNSLEYVLAQTPYYVPYWGGRTYTDLLYFPIPRSLWPNKPQREVWHEFGMKYQYLNSDDRHTSVRFNHLAEGYMNFGWVGLLLAALLSGVFLSALNAVVFRFPTKYRLLFLLCVSMPLIHLQDTTSTVVGVLMMSFYLTLFAYRDGLRKLSLLLLRSLPQKAKR